MCRPWCTRQRCHVTAKFLGTQILNQSTDRSSEEKWSCSFHRNGPVLPQRVQERKDTVSSCAFQEEHPKPLVLFSMEKWLLHYHTCTLIFCVTQSTNLGGKGWETLPSKIVSLLRNSQNEGVFHNPQRSRVTRKHKCIRFMSILPWSLSPQRGSWGCSSAVL